MLQHVEDDLIGRQIDLWWFRREAFDNVKGKFVEGTDLGRDTEAVVDTVF